MCEFSFGFSVMNHWSIYLSCSQFKTLKATKKIISFIMFQKVKIHRSKLVKAWRIYTLETTKRLWMKDTDKWKDIPCSCNRRLNIVKILISPQIILRLNAMSIKIFMGFFTEIENTILKFIWNLKGPQSAKTVWRKKNQAEGITLLNFQSI